MKDDAFFKSNPSLEPNMRLFESISKLVHDFSRQSSKSDWTGTLKATDSMLISAVISLL
jgi:hypothetical protein